MKMGFNKKKSFEGKGYSTNNGSSIALFHLIFGP